MSYLGLKRALQRAEGPGRRDDGGKPRHGWWVGVEELRKQTGRRRVSMVQSCSIFIDSFKKKEIKHSSDR